MRSAGVSIPGNGDRELAGITERGAGSPRRGTLPRLKDKENREGLD